jgi:hypothetical protein
MSKNIIKWGGFIILSCFFFYILRESSFSKLSELARQQDPDALIVYFYGFLDLFFFPAAKLFAAFAISSTLANVVCASDVPSTYTQQIVGVVEYVDFSGIRVNGSPMAEAKVIYGGVEKVFSPLPKSFRINFSKGNGVVIAYHPDNINDSVIDIESSLTAKRNEPA